MPLTPPPLTSYVIVGGTMRTTTQKMRLIIKKVHVILKQSEQSLVNNIKPLLNHQAYIDHRLKLI